MKNNRICQILGIEKPVIQGPLSWLTDARLVAAVSNAGGLGVLGPNAGLTADTAVSTPEATAEKMREEIRKTKRLTEKPFGVNLIPHTQSVTTLGRLEPGDAVNLEVDIIARYVERLQGCERATGGT